MRHFAEHGEEFKAGTPQEYVQMADEFLSGNKPAHIHECRRKRGDLLRFDPVTEAYGVLDGNGTIRTFFKPVPCVTIPLSQRVLVRLSGRCHGHPDNLSYFQSECKRW